ncbi:MAG: helix-turn-helix domain-containing protein [Thalassospira sp.]|uniref:helix-turn-helix domain-containing protein n=1 Tax=Thalassospira sp. TaxID=1912094 RepID=UPI003A84B514
MARQAPIGHRIRGRRKDIGMTQNALAKTAGISPSYLNLIEHNRRSIGGGLLVRIAEALDIHPHTLSGSEESRLLSDLNEAASDPVFRTTPIESREFPATIAAAPGMISAFLSLYRAYRSGLDEINALSERLSHDPFLTEASHSILTRITSIRTVAEIFDDYDDLSTEQRARFNATLVREFNDWQNPRQRFSTSLNAAMPGARPQVRPKKSMTCFMTMPTISRPLKIRQPTCARALIRMVACF